MTLRALRTLTAVALSTAVGLCLSACGVGDDANVGDGTQGQNTHGTGGSSTTVGSGGDTSTPPGAGGAVASTGGTKGGGTGGAVVVGTGGKSGGTGGATGGGIACGQNTCKQGEYCCNASCGMCAPMGAACIDIACPAPGACTSDADCSVHADYCGGCNCRVTGETVPACTGPQVECFADPCLGTTAACANGTCTKVKTPPTTAECQKDSDCTLQANYCTGCNCDALAPGESVPPCNGAGVQCLVDPCQTKTAACVNGACVAQ